MAYETPKTNWSEQDQLSPEDMNRVEGNTLANRDSITTNETNIDNNTSDIATLDTKSESILLITTKNFTGSASTFTSGLVNANVVLPRGFYILNLGSASSGANFTTHIIQVFINSSWENVGRPGQVYSDGTNVRIFVFEAAAGVATTYYKALA